MGHVSETNRFAVPPNPHCNPTITVVQARLAEAEAALRAARRDGSGAVLKAQARIDQLEEQLRLQAATADLPTIEEKRLAQVRCQPALSQ